MKRKTILNIFWIGCVIFGLASFVICPLPAVAQENAQENTDIDWQKFLAKQDPIWEKLPQKFDHGAFLGNGLLGTTIFQDSPQQLRFEIGRSDVTDHRRDNGRLPIGGMLLKTVGKIQSGTLRTDLWNAEVRGEIITDKGTIKFRAFNHAKEILLIVDCEFKDDERKAVFQWEPKNAVVFRDEIKKANITPNPSPEIAEEMFSGYCKQKRVAGGSYTSAWYIGGVNGKTPLNVERKLLILTVADTFPADESKREAFETLQQNAGRTLTTSKLEESHRRWWHNYYQQSFVSVPDSQIEGFYWNQIYKLASATRKDRMVIDLLGPW
ncbi:MAG: hypothetical protein LBK06_10575, partial [Planctomycetaceae bacterium]|nr:hypothetical protein [Planctomycetaceae bacterium]